MSKFYHQESLSTKIALHEEAELTDDYLPPPVSLGYNNIHIFQNWCNLHNCRWTLTTSKAHKNKPTHIEKVLPLANVVNLFHQKFRDPYLNPEAELTFADFQAAFPDVSREELEEALSHWVMHPLVRVLSTKTIEAEGNQIQVWYVHGLHDELEFASSIDRSRVIT